MPNLKSVLCFAVIGRAAGAQLPLRKGKSFSVSAVTFNAGNTFEAPEAQDMIELKGKHDNWDNFDNDRRAMLDGAWTSDIVVVGLQEFGGGQTLQGGQLFDKVEGYGVGYHERYSPDALCYAGKHYETALHVYVRNVESNQSRVKSITHIGHARGACKAKGQGCTFDNSVHSLTEKKYECGKVVNLLVLKIDLEEGAEPLKFCALNTHMSFAFPAAHRMKLIAQAMEEANDAGCGFVLFLGDFNTRLHCNEPGDTTNSSETETAQELLQAFCKDGPLCDLTAQGYRDELWQLLNRDKITCTEKGEKGEKIVVTTDNTVKQYGFKEVGGGPSFRPSYKLVSKEKTAKMSAEYVDCGGGDDKNHNVCIANKDGDPKHNPAWTDRIIYKAPTNYKVDVSNYERRIVNQYFKTDHAAVYAKFTVSPL